MMETIPQVGVVLAVYDPRTEELDAQIASLAAQTDVTFALIAVIADRRSGPLVTRLANAHGVPVDLVVPDSPTQSYDSFELGLTSALDMLPKTAHFAFCDQDDVWHPTKLAASLATLRAAEAALVHTDAEVFAEDGHLMAPSLHKFERRLMPRKTRDLLVENCVTGMTALFTREVAEAAVPFPRQGALFFHHDLWLALVADVMGGVVRHDAPLVAYRQHDRNVVGAGQGRGGRHRALSPAWRRHWGGTYFVAAYLAKSLYLRAEGIAERGSGRIDRRRLDALGPYLSERGLGFSHLSDAAGYILRGRRDLGLHSAIFAAVRWARAGIAMRETLFRGFLPALADFDRRAFAAAPGAQPAGNIAGVPSHHGPPKSAASFRDRRQHLPVPVRVDRTREAGVSILVPSLNPSEIFAGIATALDIGMGLAKRGHHVTFVATDLPVANLRATRTFLAARALGAPTMPVPDVISLPSAHELVVGPDETVIASAWWTAHLGNAIRQTEGVTGGGFYYLVQDYEPGFYPWGRDFAGALASYDLAARPIFNSQPLADFFKSQGHFAGGQTPLIFHPSIDVARYARLDRDGERPRRVAFYGRPEVARNLFPLGIEVIERFLEEVRPKASNLELLSVGMRHEDILFPGGHRLRSLGKVPWSDYPRFLAGIDVGLSLMLSPHPSHPPLEMAAAGARVVTNDFAGKCLSSLTPAIRSMPAQVAPLADAMIEAWQAGPVTPCERRFSLAPLGASLDSVVDQLSSELQTPADVVRLRA